MRNFNTMNLQDNMVCVIIYNKVIRYWTVVLTYLFCFLFLLCVLLLLFFVVVVFCSVVWFRWVCNLEKILKGTTTTNNNTIK